MRAPFAVAPLVVALLAAPGCAPSDLEVHRARLAAERRNLEQTLDVLEDRLLVNQARVRQWQDLKSRHESVSAVACASLDQHAEEMARRVLPEAGAPGVRVATGPRSDRAAASRGASQ
jgi:hypothetical protein